MKTGRKTIRCKIRQLRGNNKKRRDKKQKLLSRDDEIDEMTRLQNSLSEVDDDGNEVGDFDVSEWYV